MTIDIDYLLKKDINEYCLTCLCKCKQHKNVTIVYCPNYKKLLQVEENVNEKI